MVRTKLTLNPSAIRTIQLQKDPLAFMIQSILRGCADDRARRTNFDHLIQVLTFDVLKVVYKFVFFNLYFLRTIEAVFFNGSPK